MKYLIAYKQNDDYVYVNSIGTTIGKTTAYYSAMDFITKENAKSVCSFLNDYDKSNEYVVVKYEYTIEEVK